MKARKKVMGFLAVELMLYLGFLSLDFALAGRDWPTEEGQGIWRAFSKMDWSGGLKYLSVLVCFLWQLGKKELYLERAQLFILGADLLLLSNRHVPLGVFFFLGVQLYYRFYLCGRNGGKAYMLQVALGVLAMLGIIRALKVRDMAEVVLYLLAAAYAVALLSNLYLAWRKGKSLFATGIGLLLLCDIHVLLYNLPVHLEGSWGQWQELSGNLMWLFYLPSQVLVALESVRDTEPLLYG